MGFLNLDKLKYGKAKYCIEKAVNFVGKSVDSTILQEIVGTQSFSDDCLAIATSSQQASVKSFEFDMSKLIMGECIVEGLRGTSSYLLSLEISDGTNTIKIYSNDSTYNPEINACATYIDTNIDGVETTGVAIAPNHNVSGQGTRQYNVSFGFDKNTNRIELRSSGYYLGYVSCDKLSVFGKSTFKICIKSINTSETSVKVGQIRYKLYY